MELDFSQEWHIIGPSRIGEGGPGAFAARELASIIGRMGCPSPLRGSEDSDGRLIILDAGQGSASLGMAPRYSWRASSERVEIFGWDEASLLHAVYDFLEALGARWVEPGDRGERLPQGPLLSLEKTSASSQEGALPATLILGHGILLEDWEERLVWAARAGYVSVFIHTTPDALALGSAPESLCEALRPALAPLLSSLGLALELGGHSLSSLLPRSLFKSEPKLFRENKGERTPDRNFCPSSTRALEIVSKAFALRAASHPEVSVFHAWPDDLPGGGWCSCPSCAPLSPAAQSLLAARSLAASLALVRPDARLAFLAYHDTQDTVAVLEGGLRLPSNLELLWAPRLRSWGSPLGDGKNALNAASLAAFRRSAKAWRAGGGGRISVFEYWEDAVLFKGAVPPLSAVMEGDLAAYRCAWDGCPQEAADAAGILCTGGRPALGPRPNVYLLPRLASGTLSLQSPLAPPALADWSRAAYGKSAPDMLEYWKELEAAWALDLDLEEGETAIHMPDSPSRYAIDPPADWGDPWKAGVERLLAKRGRCEELFDHLRRAETLLPDALAASESGSREERAIKGEAAEYAISGAVLELNCARLAAYHELAGGDPRAAADIANIALSASKALRKALSGLGDPRARREIGLLVLLFYDLRLRAIRRANARSALRRLVDLWFTTARTALLALRVARVYEGQGLAPSADKH